MQQKNKKTNHIRSRKLKKKIAYPKTDKEELINRLKSLGYW